MFDTLDVLLADYAYDSDALRTEMAARCLGQNQAYAKPPNHKRRPAFSTFLYRYRNLAENFFIKIKQLRSFAIGYGKRGDSFLASVHLVFIRIWLRNNEPVA
ncbi:transposase [Novosphingobium sp. AP12]|uniref:transposase n=1 Tax=Novosphingobium sp. AP12 TaxID=1144305 RepID=UPI000271F5B1|nr:transposase [Novosphingobium sp. AP12]EJL35184.1 transposase [Novosphingobium sp. AP12]